ncbi:MAG: hypothetical protein OZSIB_3049 [Candidatus Ozemobacter sibiricus]|uniref:Uncharacterized protein n=1 Tax=Candidatus Ozemobacter sibiricus TaxID=2268124 RepID=A0A367ZRR8_9BACT|nr:MAG: hypothetical protein OZSIB_3049 [Candidatus Ozemobacter sibiricus]
MAHPLGERQELGLQAEPGRRKTISNESCPKNGFSTTKKRDREAE